MKNLSLLIFFTFSLLRLNANADITFCVDLSCFSSITAPTVFGAFNGWNAGANPITDQGNGTYCATISMPSGAQEYNFYFQEEGEEGLTPGDPCTTTNFGFTNRLITVVDNVPQTVTYGWEVCGPVCVPPPAATDITLCVDLSCMGAVQAPSVFGAFNGWNAGANPVTDPDGDGTYCATVGMVEGPQEYKFFFQEAGPENLTTPADDACTVTNFGFTNRIVDVVAGAPQTLTYGWGSCDNKCELTEPQMNAPNPNCASSEVVSLFSDYYINEPVASWFGTGSSGTESNYLLNGNGIKLYENLDIIYVEIDPANLVNIAGMNTLNIDFWTPDLDLITFRIFDAGMDGNIGGDDDAEMEYSCTNVQLCQWNTFQIPITPFVDLMPSTGIVQLQIQGLPAGSGKVFLDNIYFSKDPCDPYTNDIPLVAAPDPTCDPANVISLFSDA
jgi:hypothetical protein